MTVFQRRDFFKRAAITAATAALPATAMAYQGPITETPEPELPEWFKRLQSDVQHGTQEDACLALVFALHRMLGETAPKGSRIMGFQYRGNGRGGVDFDTIWATARDEHLHHWRPADRDGWFRGFGGIPSEREAV